MEEIDIDGQIINLNTVSKQELVNLLDQINNNEKKVKDEIDSIINKLNQW